MDLRDISKALAFATATIALPACHGSYSSAVGLPSDSASWSPKLPEATVLAAPNADPKTQEAMTDLVEQTRKVITSPRFREHLSTYSKEPDLLLMSPTGDYEDGKTVLASYLGVLSQRRPVPVKILAGFNNEVPAASTVTCDAGTRAVVELGPVVLRRWKRGSSLSKSCAINALAHELAHTVVDFRGGEAWQPYKDEGTGWMWLLGGKHVVSFAVGAIAQCTYLEQSGGLTTPFDQCVRDRGTQSFNASGCDADGESAELGAPKPGDATATDACAR